MSLTRASRMSLEPSTSPICRRASRSRSVRPCKARLKPMMPFSGVRISWLITARKRDLAWAAFSASARAARAVAWLRSSRCEARLRSPSALVAGSAQQKIETRNSCSLSASTNGWVVDNSAIGP